MLDTAKTPFGAPTWGPNVEEFLKRFDPKLTFGDGPNRLKNLYFAYLVEMRALVKVAPYLLEVICRAFRWTSTILLLSTVIWQFNTF